MITTVLACLLSLIVGKVLYAIALAQRYNGLPGYYGIAFWRWTLITPGHPRWGFFDEHMWKDQGRAYAKYGLSGYMIRSLWTGHSTLIVSDMEGIKQVTSSPGVWIKPLKLYSAIGLFGPSLLVTEGDDYKRHRKAGGPAFGEGFNRGMWDNAIRLVDEWIDRFGTTSEDDSAQRVINMADASRQLTFKVIASAGFGAELEWPDDDSTSTNKLQLSETLRGTLRLLIVRKLLPRMIWRLPLESTHRINTLFSTFESQVGSLVAQRRKDTNLGLERNDLLSRLIKANDSQSDKDKLADQELLANIHIFLTAGFETTAHAVTVTLMFLALHPEHQAAVAEEARSVLDSDGVVPTYEKFSQLKLTTATFLEGMRLYPRVLSTPKVAATDTTLVLHTSSNKAGEVGVPVQVPVGKGTHLRIDITALGIDTQHWGDDANTFRPSRFLDTEDYKWPRDAFLGFSAGLRGCIGKQSAMVEGTAILARILAKFKVEPPAAEADKWKLRAGETELDRRQRVYMPFKSTLFIAAPPLNIAFVPRE